MDINLRVTSTAFSYDGFIPSEYTADGENISPPLTVGNIGPGAVSITVIVDDPDAPLGTFIHWLIWNIPVQFTKYLREFLNRERLTYWRGYPGSK